MPKIKEVYLSHSAIIRNEVLPVQILNLLGLYQTNHNKRNQIISKLNFIHIR